MKKYPIVSIVNDMFYAIKYEDDTISIQRRYISCASNSPITGNEETVVLLCDKIIGED